jgi:superoxide dismutase, Cu-Zn family
MAWGVSDKGSHMTRQLVVLGSALIVAACSQQGRDQQPPVGANRTATASKAFTPPPDPFGWPIVDRTDTQVGTVATRLDKQGGVLVSLDTAGLSPGRHGVHIHQIAKCEAPRFESARSHWNWTQKKHGHLNPRGHHAGDLGNLTVGADGKGQATFVVPLNDWDPKATGGLPLVIHASADDDRTDPAGNSGERIACGVFYLRRD